MAATSPRTTISAARPDKEKAKYHRRGAENAEKKREEKKKNFAAKNQKIAKKRDHNSEPVSPRGRNRLRIVFFDFSLFYFVFAFFRAFRGKNSSPRRLTS